MQDLIRKIEELRKALGVMKPKSAQNSLVPAIKPPTVKPLSMPSASVGSSSKSKLPGVAPATAKDPKAMASQLKNPKPKAPKIEVMKTDKNGQWSLDKADDEPHFAIHVDGQRISEPKPLKHLVADHGPVKDIEKNPGHRVIQVKKPQV